jgi:hypothetical protein
MQGDGLENILSFAQTAEGVAVGAALIAFFSFLACLETLRRQARLERDRLRSARESDLIRWSDEAIATLAESERLCIEKDDLLKGEEFRRRQSETTTKLSSLLDRGRLFFPNGDPERYGAHKTGAGQAARQLALEALFQAYLTLRNVDPAERGPAIGAAAQRLFEQRRIFVAEVFETIDPRRRRAIPDAPDRKRERLEPAPRMQAKAGETHSPAAAA